MTETGQLNWVDVFGSSWREDLRMLVAYWVKHIGCRVAGDGVPVHKALAGYLDGQKPLAHLGMRLEIRDDIAALAAHLEFWHGIDPSALWIGPAEGQYSASREHVVKVWSHWGFGAIRLAYVYDWEKPAADTNFGSRVVTIPRGFSVDPTQVVADCRYCNYEG
ncbi:MAG: hypothetical protein ACRCYU_04090 [Nocardioides sp.]